MKKTFLHLLFIFTFFWLATDCYVPSMEELFQEWRQPVEFTSAGIAHFFKYTFNINTYGQSFLPNSLDHLTDFLDFGIQYNKSPQYFKSSIDLFHQRVKECSYINPHAVSYFLDKFSHQVAFIFHDSVNYEQSIKDCIRKALYTYEQSDDFFNAAAQEIHKIYYGTPQEPSRFLLHQTCTRFIESLLDKVIWNPREQERTWHSLLTLAHHLEMLYQIHIIPDTQALNHLVWSLIYRYCYFISCWGSEITTETYMKIKSSLETYNTLWLNLEEQETFLLTKRERLMQAVQEGYFKANAKEKGIISDSY
ncbi:MAG: hypothetical protein WA432_04700 [Candidatus Babeliaceae bacterium]